MTTRDFSDATKQRLLELIKENEENSQEVWLVSGIWDFISDIFINSNIASYGDDIDRYHDRIIDKKDLSAAQLEEIWQNVYSIETTYTPQTDNLVEQAKLLALVFAAQIELINPAPASGGVMPFCLPEVEYAARMGEIQALGGTWKGDNISREIERENDLRMQAEVNAYLDSLGYTRKAWNAMSEDEKLAALQSMIPELNRIMGTDLELTIDTESVEWSEDNTIEMAHYDPNTNRMTVNLVALADRDLSFRMLQTVVHETRHAYQYETFNNSGSHLVTDETSQQWQDNWANYIEEPYSDYVAQPLEYDARSFAGQVDTLRGSNPSYRGSWD
jgi:hypothetical protein